MEFRCRVAESVAGEDQRQDRQPRTDDIHACIGCNQACIGHIHLGYPISCIQYPETGRELQYATRAPAWRKKRVLVAGGGPALPPGRYENLPDRAQRRNWAMESRSGSGGPPTTS